MTQMVPAERVVALRNKELELDENLSIAAFGAPMSGVHFRHSTCKETIRPQNTTTASGHPRSSPSLS
jgi:hypothetical protein